MNELQKLSQARQALSECKTLQETKNIKDIAKGVLEVIKAKGYGNEMKNDACILIVEAGIQFSKLKKEGQEKGEIKTQATAKSSSKIELDTLGVSKKESHINDVLADDEKETKEIIEDLIEHKKTPTENAIYSEKKKRERKIKIESQIKEIEKGVKTPKGKFDVIAIDPPWNYGREYDPDGSRVSNPYPEMNQDDLMKIELPANESCILWLWTTHAFIWDAKELLDHWGFTYKAILTWDKEKMGMGSWLRMQTEFCLMATKGNPIIKNNFTRDIIREPRKEHSKKPEAFYSIVDLLCPGKKIEIFSRTKRKGWEVFGDELE